MVQCCYFSKNELSQNNIEIKTLFYRRGHDVLKASLPSKQEYVLMVRLSPIQKALYRRLIVLTKECYNDSLNPIKTFCLCCKVISTYLMTYLASSKSFNFI